MFFQFFKYFQFIYYSKNQHGVHSPFIYNFITKGLYSKQDKLLFDKHQKLRQQLFNNHTTIHVTDFGAGSKVFKNNKRKVSKIAKVCGISIKKTKLLLKIITYFKPQNILEIGTSLGLSTTALQLANIDAKITTLEGCSETAHIAKKLFLQNQFENITTIVGDFSETLKKTTQNQQFDLIYFDGNHTQQATLAYFETCLGTIHNDSIFIFDDIYWNAAMMAAWSEIKKHPKVKVTVDVFDYGIVFFRREQEKEHFTIRA